jgi:hypothetical protein
MPTSGVSGPSLASLACHFRPLREFSRGGASQTRAEKERPVATAEDDAFMADLLGEVDANVVSSHAPTRNIVSHRDRQSGVSGPSLASLACHFRPLREFSRGGASQQWSGGTLYRSRLKSQKTTMLTSWTSQKSLETLALKRSHFRGWTAENVQFAPHVIPGSIHYFWH